MVIRTCRLCLLWLSNSLGIVDLYRLINKCLSIGGLNQLSLCLLLNGQNSYCQLFWITNIEYKLAETNTAFTCISEFELTFQTVFQM